MLGSNILTQKIVNILSEDDKKVREEKEIYNYCLNYIFENLFFSAFTMLIGFFFDCMLSTLIFLITLYSLRSYAGGAHANTRFSCTLISFFIYVTTILIATHLNFIFPLIWLYLFFIFIALINILGPVEIPQKKMSEPKKKSQKRNLRICSILLILLCLIFFLCDFESCYRVITICSIITFISMIIARHKKHKEISHDF